MLISVTGKCIVHCFVVHVDADQNGRTALDLAKELGHNEIVALIEAHIASSSSVSEERKFNEAPSAPTMAGEVPDEFIPCEKGSKVYKMLCAGYEKKWDEVKRYLEEEGIDPNVGMTILDVSERVILQRVLQ